MRSVFRSLGVPATKEAGNASLIGGASNRPMSAGSTDNSFLSTSAPSDFSNLQYQLVVILDRGRNGGNYMNLVATLRMTSTHCLMEAYLGVSILICDFEGQSSSPLIPLEYASRHTSLCPTKGRSPEWSRSLPLSLSFCIPLNNVGLFRSTLKNRPGSHRRRLVSPSRLVDCNLAIPSGPMTSGQWRAAQL